MNTPAKHFDSDDHALHAGFLIGTLMKSGIRVIPVMDDEGNFTPDMEIVLPQEAGIPAINIQIRVTG